MGLSIDKAIEEVQQQKLDYQEFWEEYKNEHIEALNMAINTMLKYQKIEDIYYHQSGMALENSLKEVIEHGKID